MDEPQKNDAPQEEDAARALEKLRDEYLDGWKRARADLANYKKEEVERFTAVVKFGNEHLIRELLPVLDSFDLGLAALADENPARQGMRLIRSQLEEALKRQGLERIGCSPGEPFDTGMHEAVGESPEGPPGTVVAVTSPGYRLNGKVIRPAQVMVGRQGEQTVGANV